jgi:hypothetical protein
MVDTIRTNALAAYLLRNNLVPGLEGAEVLQAEYSLGNSRFDFLLRKDGVPFLLEVKSCTLFHRKLAMFPDAETAGGRKHGEELAELAREGYRCGVLFVVQSGDVRFFLPDYHTDYAFSTALLEARHILDITAVGVDWRERGGIPALDRDRPVRQLAIPWEIAEAECRDGGAYVLVLHLPEAREIEVGRLGTLLFREGYYVYVGSAVRHLAARMARHRRRRKTLHWHIDWLREHAAFVAALPVRTGEDWSALWRRRWPRSRRGAFPVSGRRTALPEPSLRVDGKSPAATELCGDASGLPHGARFRTDRGVRRCDWQHGALFLGGVNGAALPREDSAFGGAECSGMYGMRWGKVCDKPGKMWDKGLRKGGVRNAP